MIRTHSFFLSVLAFFAGFGLLCPEAALATPKAYKPEIIKDTRTLGGFNALLPYVLPSPHQEDSGSCLYMSLTGIAEWWLAKLNPRVSRASNGPLDLSERYLINASAYKKYQKNVADWKTDSIELFNATGKSVLNSAYPFAKGWYREDSKGDIFPARPDQMGGQYGVNINWFDNLKSIVGGYVELPKFTRTVIYADPESDQWNVGLNPQGIVEKVKAALVENQAPVHVIYNHEGFWHAVYVVGFDDGRDNRQCGFVESSIHYFEELEREWRSKAAQASGGDERKKLLDKAEDSKLKRTKLKNSYENAGGCRGTGVFYVRNSEFYGQDGMYDFDPANSGEETPYAPKIMLFEYEWLEHLANHVVQIGVR
ncbi:MAG: hypothetical protein EBR09_05580 [Proteobacteria bacterium]|nr:hypothetical protein [Pseudomonadota bacterium]